MTLKTLKDFNIEDNEDANYFREGHESMHFIENYYCTEDLKEEAIKWIKNWGLGTGHDKERIAFKEFFNITDEDLK